MPAEVDVGGVRAESRIEQRLAARDLRTDGRDPERGQRPKDDHAERRNFRCDQDVRRFSIPMRDLAARNG